MHDRLIDTLHALDHLAERGTAPTRAEVAERVGVSRQAVNERLLVLRGEGLVTWDYKKPRTLRLTPAGRELLEAPRTPEAEDVTSTTGRAHG